VQDSTVVCKTIALLSPSLHPHAFLFSLFLSSFTHTFFFRVFCTQVRFKKDNVAIDCGGTITTGDVLSHDFVRPEGFQMVIEAGV
jgi:hypothetical protein